MDIRKIDWKEVYQNIRVFILKAENKARDYFSAKGADIYTRFVRRMFFILIAAGVVAIVVSLFVLLVASIAKPLTKVPSVKSMNVVAASIEVQDKGLNVEIDSKFDNTIEKYTVIEQYPRPGITVRRGRTVTLLVSMGRDVYTTPNVVGLTRENAEKLMGQMNVNYEITVVQNPDFAVDTVISQDIPPNKEVERAVKMKVLVNSDVNRGEFRVGDFTRQGADLVVKTLLANGVQPILEKITTKNPDEDGMILSQGTASGIVIPKNSQIRLQVGVYGDDDMEREKYNYYIFSYYLATIGTVSSNEASTLGDPSLANKDAAVRILLSDEKDQQQEIYNKNILYGETISLTFKAYGKAKLSLFVNNALMKEMEYE
jgi:eukaryotic-like serine/threonine-protein kinase